MLTHDDVRAAAVALPTLTRPARAPVAPKRLLR